MEIEYTIPCKPSMNGEVERYDRNLGGRIQTALIGNRNHRVVLCEYLETYRITKHSATGTSPSRFMFKRELRDCMKYQKSVS